MGKAQRIDCRDLRALYLLIGECKELGADPVAWRVHLLEGLLRLLDAVHGSCFELEHVTEPGSANGPMAPALFVDAGLTDARVRRSYRALAPEAVEFTIRHAMARNGARVGRAAGTYTRRQLIDDDVWYGSEVVHDQIQLTGLDDFVGSLAYTGPGSSFSLGVHRAVGDRPFAGRERLLIQLCVADVLPLLGARLAAGSARSLSALAPRLRQILLCLFEGDGEKQVAARLGISRHTVHEYLRRLHRAFEVSSRGDLMARCAPYLVVLRGVGAGAGGGSP
jgi:DNA-binding CsgD family transcriptional regulator